MDEDLRTLERTDRYKYRLACIRAGKPELAEPFEIGDKVLCKCGGAMWTSYLMNYAQTEGDDGKSWHYTKSLAISGLAENMLGETIDVTCVQRVHFTIAEGGNHTNTQKPPIPLDWTLLEPAVPRNDGRPRCNHCKTVDGTVTCSMPEDSHG